MTTRDLESLDPNPLMAAWRHRWLVLAVLGGFLALGASFALLVPQQYASTALLSVDRSAGAPFQSGEAISAERFVTDQVEILRSGVVARRASELLAEANPPLTLTGAEVSDAVRVSSDGEADFIEVRFRADTPGASQQGANAIAAAYQDVVTDAAEAAGRDTIERLDVALAEVEAQIAELRRQRDDLLGETAGRSQLDARLADLVAQLARLDSTATGDDVARISEELRAQSLLRDLEASFPGVGDVLQLEQNATAIRDVLQTRRGEVEAGLALAGSTGVRLFSAAGSGESTGVSLRSAIVIAMALGLLAGGGAAYLTASRRQSFERQGEPETVLGAPLLAAVPDFDAERIESKFPVRDAPWSVASESFRFAAAAFAMPGPGSAARAVSVAVVSPTLGDGKTTVAANLAMSAAREGRRVLIIDADLGNQSLSRLLRGFKVSSPGLTDIVERDTPFAAVAWDVGLGDSLNITLLGGGVTQVDPVSFFRRERTRDKLAEIANNFDLVVFDAPPLLHIAYSGVLCREVDNVVVVVRHESDVADLEQSRERLDFLGVSPLGYVYNFSPLGRSIAKTGGSVGAYMEWQGLGANREGAQLPETRSPHEVAADASAAGVAPAQEAVAAVDDAGPESEAAVTAVDDVGPDGDLTPASDEIDGEADAVVAAADPAAIDEAIEAVGPPDPFSSPTPPAKG